MAGASSEKIIVPRNFMLLSELEKAEKGAGDMSISFGLVKQDDITLSDWQCTILGPPGAAVENRILSLILHCGTGYPEVLPTVRFLTKVNFPFVGSDGVVNMKHKLLMFDKLEPRCEKIERVLVQIRNAFTKPECKKLAQPPDGLEYPN